MTTRQTMYTAPPGSMKKAIAITIRCGGCSTLRTFKVGNSVGRVAKRIDSGFGIESRCNACGLDLGVSLFWIASGSRFSYRDPIDTYEGEINTVEDDASMERKEIG